MGQTENRASPDELKSVVRELLNKADRHRECGEGAALGNKLKTILLIFPDNTKVIMELLDVFLSENSLKKSLFYYGQLARAGLGSSVNLFRVMRLLLRTRTVPEAVEFFEGMIRLNPLNTSLRLITAEMTMVCAPLAKYRKALASILILDPTNAAAAAQLASCLTLANHLDWRSQIVENWRKRALQAAVNDRFVRYSLSYGALRHSLLDTQAWSFFIAESANIMGNPRQEYPRLPRWRGEIHDGVRLLIWADDEVGIGDIIMHSGCIRYLQECGVRGAVRVPKRLKVLFRANFPEWRVFTEIGGDVSDLNSYVNALELHCFVPAQRQMRYLWSDHERRAKFRDRYLGQSRKRLVGLSWRGGSGPLDQFARTIPIREIDTLLETEEAVFVSLQHHHEIDSIALSKRHRNFVHDEKIDPLGDIDAFAAQVAAMDVVISVVNTTANLSGALGVRTLCLIPRTAQWWWGVEGSSIPWYPSMRLIRQTTPGQWGDEMREVKDVLRRLN